MRLLLGLVLGAVMGLFGLMAFAGGMARASRDGMVEVAWVGIGLGLIIIGLAITVWVISWKSARLRKAARSEVGPAGRRKVSDMDEARAVLMGVTLATMGDDNLDGGD